MGTSSLRHCFILSAAFFFLLSLPSAQAQGNAKPTVSQIVNQASALTGKGDYDAAANLCRDALRAVPDNPSLYVCIAQALTNKGSYTEATEAYEKAIPLFQKQQRSAPNLSGVYADLAALYLALNRLDEAQDRVDRSLQMYPNNVDAIISKGVILESRGQLDSAIDQYRRAMALSPKSAAASQNLGSALQKKGQLQEAVSVLQAGVQFHSNDPDLRAAYGNALLAAGRSADAERELQASLSSRPGNSSVLYNLADAQRKLGKFPEPWRT
jgi:protein O-GlcNAc transferase